MAAVTSSEHTLYSAPDGIMNGMNKVCVSLRKRLVGNRSVLDPWRPVLRCLMQTFLEMPALAWFIVLLSRTMLRLSFMSYTGFLFIAALNTKYYFLRSKFYIVCRPIICAI